MEEDPSGLRCHFRYLPPEQENTIKSVINLYNMGQIFPIENLFNALKKEKTRLEKRRKKEGKRRSFLLPFVIGIITGTLVIYLDF